MQTKSENAAVTTSSGTNGYEGADFCDVSYLNVQVMVWYIAHVLAPTWGKNMVVLPWWRRLLSWFRRKSNEEKMEIAERREMLLEYLWSGLPDRWGPDRVLRSWMPLDVYTILEWNFAKILGSPDQLFKAGYIGGYAASFGRIWVSRMANFIGSIGRFFFTVEALYSRLVPDALYELYNLNKLLTCLKKRRGRVELRTYYKQLEKGKERRRNPLDDALSYLYWATGMVAAGGQFWGVKPAVFHRLLQFDLIAFLLRLKERGFIAEEIKVCPGPEYDSLMVGEATVAIRTWFRQDPELPYFIQPTAKSAGSMTRPGWKVWEDIIVHTLPSALHPESITWTVLRSGTYCCAEAGCAESAYVIKVPWWKFWYWLPYPVGVVMSPVVIKVLGLQAKQMKELDISQQQYLQYQFAEKHRELAAALQFPSRDAQLTAERGEAQTITLTEPVSMIVDLRSSTQVAKYFKGNRAAQGRLMKQFKQRLQGAVLRYEHVQRGGDQVKLAYYDGTGDGAAIVLVDGTPTERLLAALEIAWQIHTTVPEVIGPFGPFQVRIGIERSEDLLLVSTEEAPYKLEAVGESLTMAARLQDAGKRKELFCERTIILRQGLAEEAEGEWEFECPDLHGHQLRDVDEGVKLARVVGRK